VRGQTEGAGPATAGIDLPARRWLLGALVALMVLVVIGLYAWRNGSGLDELRALGYPGVFLVMLISGGGILLPVPGQATVIVAGALWNPLVVGLVAGLGNATGELTGYALGRVGVAALQGGRAPRWWPLLQAWLGRYGFFAILAMALVPNPLFDVVGVLAGSLGYSPRRFWLACLLGNSVKYLGMAYLGGAVMWWLA